MEIHQNSKTWKLPVFIFLAIAITVSLGFYTYQSNQNLVTLKMDYGMEEILTNAKTLEELLEKEEIILEKGTYLSHPLDTEIEDNLIITIKVPKQYTIESNNIAMDVKSIYTSVADILEEKGIVLGEKDFTYPKFEDTIAPGTKIKVFRVSEVISSYEEEIPFDHIVNKNHNMDIGTTKTVQEGVKGLRVIQIRQELVDGEVFATEILGETIAQDPSPQIVEKGTKDIIVTSRGNTSYRKAFTVTATAYTDNHQSQGKWVGKTASGMTPQVGVIAVDPKVIPLGTKLYIQGLNGSKDYGFAIAGDKGSAIKGNRVDLFFDTETEVYNFGRRKVKVYILND